MSLSSESSQEAAKMCEKQTARQVNQTQVDRLSEHNKRRIDSRNMSYSDLVPRLLAVTQDKNSHWRYVLTASVSSRGLCRPVQL